MSAALVRLAAPDAAAVLRRFPFVVLAAAMIVSRELFWEQRWQWEWRPDDLAWRFGWGVLLLSSITLGLRAEFAGFRRPVLVQSAGLVLGALAWLGYGTPWISPFWTLTALAGFIVLSPKSGDGEQALWSFNVRAAMLLTFALIATSVFVLGLFAIEQGLEYLFDVKFDWIWTSRIQTVGYWFVLPVYWSALLPKGADALAPLAPDELLSKAAAALSALSASVTTALAALIHVYAGKIAFDGALPKSRVAYIVCVCLLCGLLGWLLAAGEGGLASGPRKAFRRFWFPATVVPTILLGFAIWQRIDTVGVTWERYAVAFAAVCSTFYIVASALRRGRPSIRTVLAIATALALVAAIGPTNMSNVVAGSQIERLRSIIASDARFEGGRVTGRIPYDHWSRERRKDVDWIISSIADVGALGRLRAVAPTANLTSRHEARWYFGTTLRDPNDDGISLPQRPSAIDFEGWRLIGPLRLSRDVSEAQSKPQQIDDVTAVLERSRLSLRRGGQETVFDLSPLEAFADDAKRDDRPSAIVSTDGRSTMQIQNASLSRIDGQVTILSIEAVALVRDR